MMALIRFIYDFSRKEELVILKYIRSHPRRNWLIALDALITISIVVGGFVYTSQPSKNATSLELMRIGAIPMTTTEFMEHARANAGREYWLGEIKGFGISSDERRRGVTFVSYMRNGADPRDLKGRDITIVTYSSPIAAEGIHQFSAGSEPSTLITARGVRVEYDKTSMMDEVVSFNDNSNKVSIHYLEAQSLQTLMANAMALRVAK